MDSVYIKYYLQIDSQTFQVPLKSLITLFICKYVRNVKVILIRDKIQSYGFNINIDLDFEISETELMCELPCIKSGNIFISGLCAVNRQIVKQSGQLKLLGFKEACLRAPNEVSIWTKFCEIDMIKSIEDLYSSNIGDEIVIPVDLVRLENHMSQPVRIHNIYKLARNYNSIPTDCSTPKEDLNIPHQYVEGPFLTIADLILIPQVYLMVDRISEKVFGILPLTGKWYEKMKLTILDEMIIKTVISENLTFIKPEVKVESLYKSDPKRYKPQNRIYTKQVDIDNSFEIIENIEIFTPTTAFGNEITLNWEEIPKNANPIGGNLPNSRSSKKFQQLENLAKAVMKLAKRNDVIVDFCSGTGHLGILLAYCLPKCSIILLENKEESITRAQKRVELLNLQNVTIVQSNLDYFIGNFNIGISLHACGVATDLVIQKCLVKSASFVCCPCCYGGIHNCHHLTYPRSLVFKEKIDLKSYLVLGHSADQTHDEENVKTKQGEFCMNVIDTDRILQVKEFGYEVVFGKLEPSSCTPKNNLIVGWPKINL